MQPIHGREEANLLALLREVQQLLARALDSLAGKTSTGKESGYLAWAAVAINRAADGYMCLRDSGRVDASKVLVRPAVEALFNGGAMVKDSGFFFRKAYSEWLEDVKLVGKDATAKAVLDQQLDELKRACAQASPASPMVCKRVTVREAAEKAGLLNLYKTLYRVYCQFTHSSLRAVYGDLNPASDPVETELMISCVLTILNLMQKHTPAQVPDLSAYCKRLADASALGPHELQS
jgi:hypothetical protein